MPSALDVHIARSPLAGQPAPKRVLVDIAGLEREYYARWPDASDVRELVSFGAGGHRGSPLFGTFTEAHVQAITQAICDYRQAHAIDGPLYMGKDTHALSGPAHDSALEVLAANGVETVIQRDDGVTPTPVISRAIVMFNRKRAKHLADGIIMTPSHNPPEDGGFKYNPPHGGPADSDITQWIEKRANDLLREDNTDVRRVSYARAIAATTTCADDLIVPYVRDLASVLDMDAIRDARLRVAVDPLGGASLTCWEAIDAVYGLNIDVVNRANDPTFSFMSLDYDGRIRMDCSSPYATARLVALKDEYDVAFSNDPDAERHGIVAPSEGLLNANHFLAVAIRYLLSHRPKWAQQATIGKTVVTSSLIDRVVRQASRRLVETPVGFKWFTRGLHDGACCFAGEESAGASFLRRDGTVWTTDKDGIIMSLLAAEITARTGRDPAQHYRELSAALGTSYYRRIDSPATPGQKARLETLSPLAIDESSLAGEPIAAKLTRAPSNGALIGGLKVITRSGWFAARPSATENIYKIYAESFQSEAHLETIISEARDMVRCAMAMGGAV